MAGDRSSVFIDMEINQLVNRMLESVKQTYNLDLASDFDLNTSLRLHMVSLRIRLQYRLKMDNPILKEIKKLSTTGTGGAHKKDIPLVPLSVLSF